MHPFTTYQAFLDYAKRLEHEGWDLLPDDEPKLAEVGIIAKKPALKSARERRLSWFPYGKPLVPHVTYADDLESFTHFLERHITHRLYKCDNPTAEMLGLVCYCEQHAKKALVIEFPFEVADTLGPQFLTLRGKVATDNLQHLLLDA